MRRRLALTGILAVVAVALGAGTATATTWPESDDDATVTVVKAPSGGYTTLKRSW